MSREFPQLKEEHRGPFEGMSPRLLRDGAPAVDLEVRTLHAHGGYFTSKVALPPLPLGSFVSIEFCLKDSPGVLVLKAAVVHREEKVLGLVFVQITQHLSRENEALDTPDLLPCPAEMLPIAWGDHPWFFNYRLKFHVVGFVKNGMKLTFAHDSYGIVEGNPFDLQVVIPGVDTFAMRVSVRKVRLSQKAQSAEAVVDFVAPSEAFLTAVSRYFLMSQGSISPEMLERNGYPFPDFDFAAVSGFAHTPAEVKEMLALRFAAYRPKGATDPEVMRDRFDAHSLIISMRLGGKVVGTTRLVFNDGDRTKSEIEEHVKLPDWLWEAGFVELSRSATISDLRGKDLFSNLRRHAIRNAYQCGYRYIVADCEAHLLEPYKRRGARELGLTFVHPLEGKTLHVLLYDIPAILRGEVGDPAIWESFWAPMAKFLLARHQ